MNIVLGIFHQPHFYNIATQTGYCSYPFEELIGMEFDGILDCVHKACLAATNIIFIIDGIRPIQVYDYSSDSYTCQELSLILTHSDNTLINKVIWMEDNQVISKEQVSKKLNIPMMLLE